jgi:hypothetical protein
VFSPATTATRFDRVNPVRCLEEASMVQPRPSATARPGLTPLPDRALNRRVESP